jgi:hypothetical protein
MESEAVNLVKVRKRVTDIEAILSKPRSLPPVADRYRYPYLDYENYQLSWNFMEPNWAEDLGVHYSLKHLPLFHHGNELEAFEIGRWQPSPNIWARAAIVGLLLSFDELDKYWAEDASADELREILKDTIVGVAGGVSDQPFDIFILDCINSLRSGVGALPALRMTTNAFGQFARLSFLNSFLNDCWETCQAGNTFDRLPILGNIAVHGPTLAHRSSPIEGWNFSLSDWHHQQGLITFRYVATLLILGLREDAVQEWRAGLSGIVVRDAHRALIEGAFDLPNPTCEDFRVGPAVDANPD